MLPAPYWTIKGYLREFLRVFAFCLDYCIEHSTHEKSIRRLRCSDSIRCCVQSMQVTPHQSCKQMGYALHLENDLEKISKFHPKPTVVNTKHVLLHPYLQETQVSKQWGHDFLQSKKKRLICMINCTMYIVLGHVGDLQQILHMHGEENHIYVNFSGS